MPIGPIELDSLQAIERPAESSHRLFFSRDFGWLWWGQLVSQVGDGITRLALLWYVYSVTGGGPVDASYVLELYVYRVGFRDHLMGAASAAAGVLIFVIFLLIVLQLRFLSTSKETE